MRSRTELVTTTFIDSEQEQTESEDSEEDWRPQSSRKSNQRKPKKVGRRRNKRKSVTAAGSVASKLNVKRRFFGSTTSKTEPEDSDDGSDYQPSQHCPQPQKTYSHPITKAQSTTVEQRQFTVEALKAEHNTSSSEISKTFSLYLYKKDLDKDFKSNSHLCLWRRDDSNLLQKYIRVKTNNCEEFIFTSSSVYSSWDERRRKDFANVTVKCMENNNRRVIITEPEVLQILANERIQCKNDKTEGGDGKADDDSSNEMLDSQEDEDDDFDEDDGEDEISADEEDINSSAKTSEDDEDCYEREEGSTNEGTSKP